MRFSVQVGVSARLPHSCDTDITRMGTETYTIIIGGKGGTEKKEFTIHTSAAFEESSALGRWCMSDRHQREDLAHGSV